MPSVIKKMSCFDQGLLFNKCTGDTKERQGERKGGRQEGKEEKNQRGSKEEERRWAGKAGRNIYYNQQYL